MKVSVTLRLALPPGNERWYRSKRWSNGLQIWFGQFGENDTLLPLPLDRPNSNVVTILIHLSRLVR